MTSSNLVWPPAIRHAAELWRFWGKRHELAVQVQDGEADMARSRARINNDAAWTTYRRELARAGRQMAEDTTDPDMDAPAPVVPGPIWYRSTFWPDADQILSGRGGWWDDGDTAVDDESTPSGSRTLATRS